MRAALYARVSTDDQAEKYGLASQVRELHALAQIRGYELVAGGEYLDDGYSGASLDRPALDRLRVSARDKAFEVLLVHDPDRLSRKLAHQLLLFEEFERAGIALDFVTVNPDVTPEGRLLLQVKGVIAEYEREKIKERTQRGRRERAHRGLISVYPFGYRRDPTAPGRPVIEASEASVVRMIFAWLIDEQRSVRAIVRELRALGVRGRGVAGWGPTSVNRLLRNPYYAGRTWYNRLEVTRTTESRRVDRLRPEPEWISIDVPAIITPERFELAQRQLVKNGTWLSGRPAKRVYLLRGLLRHACGHRMSGDTTRGHSAYRCIGRLNDLQATPGTHRCIFSMPAPRLDQTVWDTVVAILRNPRLIEAKLAEREAAIGARDVEMKSELAQLEREAARLARDEQRLLDLYLAQDLDVEVLRRRLVDVRRRKAAVDTRLER